MLDKFDDVMRESHEIDFTIYYRFFGFKKKLKINMKFQEASVYEHIKLWSLYKNKIEFVEYFVKKYGRVKGKKIKDKYMVYIVYQWEKIWEAINELYFQWLYKETKETQKEGYFASYITFLSKEMWIDPLYLMKNYTFKQLEYFSGGVIRNLNEATKEGKKKNRLRKIADRKREDVDYDKILASVRKNV